MTSSLHSTVNVVFFPSMTVVNQVTLQPAGLYFITCFSPMTDDRVPAGVAGAAGFMLTEDANQQPYKKQKQEALPEKPFNFQDYVPPLLFDYDYENNEYQTITDALLAQERAAREQKWREQKERADEITMSRQDLPIIPSDPAQYSVTPTTDTNAAAAAGIQQLLVRSGVAGGGILAQKLLSMGGPYGYLGAAAIQPVR